MRFAVPVLLLLAPFAPAQTPDEIKATLKFIASLRDPNTGAYAVNPPKSGEKPTPSLRAVNGATKAIKYMGGEVTDKDKLVKFVLGCYDDKTGAFAEPGGKPDVAVTSVGVMAAIEVGVPKEKIKKAMEYLAANAKEFEDFRIGSAAIEAWGVKDSPISVESWVSSLTSQIGDRRRVVGAADPDAVNTARETAGVAATLLRLGRPIFVFEQVAVRILLDGQRDDGGWGKKGEKASDAESTYRVMRALMLLKEKPKDVDGVAKFFASCRRKDGGYGVDAAASSSMSGVYYFAVVRHWLSEMEKK
jgi:hypothetical protein